jgi:hypothetical protein
LGGHSARICYYDLGTSEGFGSFQFGKETIRLSDALLGRSKNGRKVNSIFGEGVNPLMRKVLEALDFVGQYASTVRRSSDERGVRPSVVPAIDILLSLDVRAGICMEENIPYTSCRP